MENFLTSSPGPTWGSPLTRAARRQHELRAVIFAKSLRAARTACVNSARSQQCGAPVQSNSAGEKTAGGRERRRRSSIFGQTINGAGRRSGADLNLRWFLFESAPCARRPGVLCGQSRRARLCRLSPFRLARAEQWRGRERPPSACHAVGRRAALVRVVRLCAAR